MPPGTPWPVHIATDNIANCSTVLENYLSRSLGFCLILMATLILLLTGSIPLATSIAETATAVGTSASDPTAPYAVPALSLTLAYHGTVAFYCYSKHTQGMSMAFAVAAVVSGALGALGGWCLLFGTTSGHLSKSE